MTTRGVLYVAYGAKAIAEATASLGTLRAFHDWPVVCIGDGLPGTTRIPHPNRGKPGRWAKVNLDLLTPFDETLFLDADTRVHGALDAGFGLLERGADIVLVPSRPQRHEALRHLLPVEREATLAEVMLDPLQLNTGVLWFHRARVAALFAAWRAEWERYQDADQGALLRALERVPVVLRLLGYPFNDARGQVIEHRFGKCSG